MSGDTQEHKALSSKSGKELFKDLLNDVTVRAISALKEVISGKSPLEVTTMEAEINHCIMQAVKLPLNKLSEIWDTYDTDGNHQLDQTENRQLIADYFSEAVKAQPELVVKTQDATVEEIVKDLPEEHKKQVLAQIAAQKPYIKAAVEGQMKMLLEKSDEIADRVWKVMDANKDGIITKTEFLAKFQQLMDTGFQMVP